MSVGATKIEGRAIVCPKCTNAALLLYETDALIQAQCKDCKRLFVIFDKTIEREMFE